MSVGLSLEGPAEPAQSSDVLTVLDLLQAQVRSAEDRAAHLERALASNRRIGMAVGILMCRHQLTDDQAIAVIKTESQHRNVKVCEIAERVIYTGTI